MTTHNIALALAIVLAGIFALARLNLRCSGTRVAWKVELLSLTVLAGAIGAVGGFQLYMGLSTLAGHAPSYPESRGGTILGALLAGGLAGLGYCHWRRLPPGEIFDAAVVPLPLGQAIGRLGCLAAGCCWGRTTDSWIGMNLPGDGGIRAVRYPTQLLSSGADLLIFLLLVGVERHYGRRVSVGGARPFAGSLALSYGGLYLIKRFAMEFLRGDGVLVVVPLTLTQVLCLVAFAVIGGLWIWNLLRARRQAAGSGSPTGWPSRPPATAG